MAAEPTTGMSGECLADLSASTCFLEITVFLCQLLRYRNGAELPAQEQEQGARTLTLGLRF